MNLFTKVPDFTVQSFFGGSSIILLKGFKKILEKLSPMHHATELFNQVKEINGGISQLNKEIILLVTDGCGDYNVTHSSVRGSLMTLFLQTNSDMPVTIRTCPTQS